MNVNWREMKISNHYEFCVLQVRMNIKFQHCWHVLQESVCLSLMERTTSLMFYRKKHKLRRRSEQYAETRKLRRDSSFQNCRRGPRDGLAVGEKVETREHLENILSRRDHKLRRKSDSGH